MRTYSVSAHGMRLTGTPLGGQLLSWEAAGRERLFRGPLARMQPGGPIRGGVPVVFPQFGARGPGPRHGFARTLAWDRVPGSRDDTLAFVLRDSPATRAAWPHAFEMRLEGRLEPGRLVISLGIRNNGPEAFGFTAALHTYLRVEDVQDVRVMGLEGARFIDATRGDREGVEAAGPRFGMEMDRIYAAAGRPLRLVQDRHGLDIRMDGFTDVVVWNPGPDQGPRLADLGPDDHRRFVCVEAGAILTPVTVAPGHAWRGSQSLALPDPA